MGVGWVDVNDPWTWAIRPDMVCEVEDLPPLTDEECAAVARILDELRVLRVKRRRAPTETPQRGSGPRRPVRVDKPAC
jgi:hypothetical protein